MKKLNFLEEFGFKYKVVSCSHLPEIEREYNSLLKNNNFNQDLYEKSITKLNFRIPEYFLEARSIIVIAVPSFRSEAAFHYHGKYYSFTIPPTYRGYDDKPANVLKILSEYSNNKT